MCGIIGYAGPRDAREVLIGGIKKLEYRGYDSAGIALAKEKQIEIHKSKGKVAVLEKQVSQEKTGAASIGIGHTRWATHGAPSDVNAHPHRSGKIVLVHNGIIENEQALRTTLAKRALRPISDTDTELVALLLNDLYDGDPIAALRQMTAQLEGAYALGILFEDQPGKLYALRKDSPLIIGRGKGEHFIASDIPAILEYTHDYWLLEEGEIAVLTAEKADFINRNGELIEKELRTADWSEQSAQKEGYAHFMAKEIAEQPDAIRKTLGRYYHDGKFFEELGEDFTVKGTIRIVACGSAYHAGLLGKYAIEKLARIPVTVEFASEFRYRDPILSKEDLVIVISQSGETADSLAALRLANERKIQTMAIVNVWGSSIARDADIVLYTAAGPEISVATTKAYTCQVTVLYLLAMKLAEKVLSPAIYQEKCAELEKLPQYVQEVLKQDSVCKTLAKLYYAANDLFFIGRGQDYYVSCEGSLKVKEISYIHSEAYAAGELKHGTISLVEDGTPIIAVITDRTRILKSASNIREVHARGAKVLCITYGDVDISSYGDHRLTLPDCSDFVAPIPGVILTQLLAYHIAVARGNDVDQPRNLAKSVTVE